MCNSYQLEIKKDGTLLVFPEGHNAQNKVFIQDSGKKSQLRHLISPQGTIFHQHIKLWQNLN